MSDRPKLLWHSNAPWSQTGYGNQTGLFSVRLKDHYEISISAFFGLEANILPFNGIPVMPGAGGTYGNETILDHAKVFFKELREGLVLTLMDVWVLNPSIWRQLNVASWVPIDHEPCPSPIAEFFHESSAVPVAMSRFGETQLQNAGLDPLYCPHAIDCSLYKPTPKEEAREITKLPQDAFVVGMVAANKGNPSRKCFSEAFQAFKQLHDKHDDALLYLHTELTGKFDGVNLPALIDAVGLPRDAVVFCDQYRAVHYPFPPETMAAVYSSLDVLLMPSAGEGFGIPAVEAQACGVPVVASDFSAQPELTGAGWLVSGHRNYTALKAWQFTPDVEDIADCLRQAYALPKATRRSMAEKARQFAEQYHVDHVLKEHMLPALKSAGERFEERKPLGVIERTRKANAKKRQRVAA